MNRREFLEARRRRRRGRAAARRAARARPGRGRALYDASSASATSSLLHFTDCHAQLLPIHFREPSVNLGIGAARGRPPHLVGEALLRHFGIAPGTRDAHAFTYLDFDARGAGVRHDGRLRASRDAGQRSCSASRPGALLLDGGDTWQGSATALWTQGQDMVDAQKLLGVDVMTGHWEFTLGAERVKEVVEQRLRGQDRFRRAEREDRGLRRPGVPAVRDRARSTACRSRSSARPFRTRRSRIRATSSPSGRSASRRRRLQKVVDEARAQGRAGRRAAVAQRHGRRPQARLARARASTRSSAATRTTACRSRRVVANRGGRTLVTNAGSNGKFLAVLDLDVQGGKVADFRYRLLPVFATCCRRIRRWPR